MDLDRLMADCFRIASEHGWSSLVPIAEPSIFSEKMLLVVSEISEALEEFRNHHEIDEVYFSEGGKPEGIPIELADAIIRILDFCSANGVDIVRALELKMSYNETRPFRHGGKKA